MSRATTIVALLRTATYEDLVELVEILRLEAVRASRADVAEFMEILLDNMKADADSFPASSHGEA